MIQPYRRSATIGSGSAQRTDQALASASPFHQSQASEPVSSPSRPSALILDAHPNDVERRSTARWAKYEGTRGGPDECDLYLAPSSQKRHPSMSSPVWAVAASAGAQPKSGRKIWTENLNGKYGRSRPPRPSLSRLHRSPVTRPRTQILVSPGALP